MKKFEINGKRYMVPDKENKELSDYIKNEWSKAQAPPDTLALSFTHFLREWAEEKWGQFIEPVQNERN